jgi:DUF1680 family protein
MPGRTTDYPYDGIVSLALTIPTSLRFTLRLRIPAWAHAAQVHINGRRDPAICVSGTFAAIDREWRSGDRVDLQLSLPLRCHGVDAQHPHTVALLAGPLVLMNILEQDGGSDAMLSPADLLSARRPFATAHEWQVQTPDRTLIFRPFIDIHDERYRVYHDVAMKGRF